MMPDYIEGAQAESLVEQIMQSVPADLPKTKRKKLIREKIKEAFHLQDGKMPHWVHGSDWPFGKSGKPLQYLSRKTHGELTVFLFRDVDTGETAEIEEYS